MQQTIAVGTKIEYTKPEAPNQRIPGKITRVLSEENPPRYVVENPDRSQHIIGFAQIKEVKKEQTSEQPIKIGAKVEYTRPEEPNLKIQAIILKKVQEVPEARYLVKNLMDGKEVTIGERQIVKIFN